MKEYINLDYIKQHCISVWYNDEKDVTVLQLSDGEEKWIEGDVAEDIASVAGFYEVSDEEDDEEEEDFEEDELEEDEEEDCDEEEEEEKEEAEEAAEARKAILEYYEYLKVLDDLLKGVEKRGGKDS